jgi:hypothetical protein
MFVLLKLDFEVMKMQDNRLNESKQPTQQPQDWWAEVEHYYIEVLCFRNQITKF